ncbi:AAA family ATPase [Sphingomonas sp. PL-96]|uniref:AAA family ATPase n=1 Tax=Sphingomonas sp. PL-96 TaxID=2887201 RepID=UPI001E3D013D|nr:AAA family ATPase [Sphingomonas sp. PL-96]MCC2976052.1 AAA family ATPase [Sphingomonas sp. PL-96]
MIDLVGNGAAHDAFFTAAERGGLHHAWLLAGPEGVGKASFARLAASRLLAHGVQPRIPVRGGSLPPEDRTAALIAAGSHPDYRELARQPKDPAKPDENLARSIPIAQVRALQPLFATKPSLSERRVVLIDAIDDLETAAANALLKNLEEPPAGTIFLLVSHAPGRLLPTIRSRCRLLRFERLSDADVARVIRGVMPEVSDVECDALVRGGEGSPGRALAFAGLDVAALERAMAVIAGEGDPSNVQRSKLAKALAGKAAQARYEAFLERAPSFIAIRARERTGSALQTALDAYQAARALAAAAPALSLDAQATVFEMGGILARLAEQDGLQSRGAMH